MKTWGRALRLTIYISNGDTWHHRPLGDVLLERARAAGFNGASLFEGVSGFGSAGTTHRKRAWSLVPTHPVAITIVDEEDRIRSFLDTIDELVGRGVVTLDACEMVRLYRVDNAM